MMTNNIHTMEKSQTIRVLGIFNVIPLYREAVFKILWSDPTIEYTICAGKNLTTPALKVISEHSLTEQVKNGRFFTLKNYWLGKHFLWQKGVCRPSFTKDYDVIIHTGSMYQLSTWIALIIGQLQGKRQLLWTHGLRSSEESIKGKVRRLFYRLSDGLLLYGHTARNLLIDYGFDPDTLYVIYNSLDYEKQLEQRAAATPDEMNSVRQKLFYEPQLPILIYIGRLTKEKQLPLLVDLVKEMKKRETPVNLIIIGDGPERAILKNKVSRNALDGHICIFGPCHDETILTPILLASDIAIIPGYAGLSTIHCMAYGLPVLTSDDLKNQKPESEAIISGITGDFYEHGNLISLADIVGEWLTKVGPECRSACIKQIETFYNPSTQHIIINHACTGLPASSQPYKDNTGFIK